ncbi:MAG: SusD/RagB family nutrient-binding outer membrane lipoprotein, partial [Spirosomataceae bacterium]
RRTAWGLYPAGGLYDNDAGRIVALVAGAQGAGVQPIMMRSFVDFMLAESALTLQTAGSARALLESGIRKSMEDVRSFAMSSAEANKITAFEASKGTTWAAEVEAYVTATLAEYDAATSNADKLNVVANQYWFAAHGNGIESYNLYRRTGMPRNLQPALEANPGPFVQSYYYPLSVITRNNAIVQKNNATVPVFWDNKSAGTLR